MNKIRTILLILCVIGLFTTAFVLNDIRTELKNEPLVNNTTNGTGNLTNNTNETLNTTLIDSTEYDTEESATEPVEETTDEDSTAHEMYKSQFNPKDGEPKGCTLKEEYIESTGASNGKELQEYMESHPPEDYK